VPLLFDPAELCARILVRDRRAEEEFVERFLPRVRAMISARSNDKSALDDLGQEVMIAALSSLRERMPRDPEALPSFIFGIARNIVNGYFRRQSRERTEELGPTESIPDRTVISRESEMVQDARHEIERLEPGDREVLNLTLNEGLEPAEIAERLGITGEAVRQRKSRAMKRLLERLSRGRGAAPLHQ
jgi:RNA polymerase sigma factor (sigma-70 family)